jgi:hypothetical protein
VFCVCVRVFARGASHCCDIKTKITETEKREREERRDFFHVG